MEKEKNKEDISNEEIKKVTIEPEIKKEKHCIKCNAIIKEGDDFCTRCGAKQIEPKIIKEKNKGSKNKSTSKNIDFNKMLIICGITLVLCITISLLLGIKFKNSGVHIDNTNKNVSIDDTGIADAVEKVYDSVVVIENNVNDKLYATGSGFVYKTDSKYGYILTNNHVIKNATEIYALLTNNKKVKADVVGNDEYSDIAVLKIDKKYVKQVALIGNNKKMRLGDTTFAVGTPLDSNTYSWTVTRGILSGKDRLVADSHSYMTVLQTDTPINSGNSGGPLCNANGEVIGITNMKLASEQIEGMGFAIPIETAIEYADKFVTGKNVRRPYIGVAIYDNVPFFNEGVSQVVVESVEPKSPADKAGIKPGDIIFELEGEKIENASHFKYKLYSYKIGDKVKITVLRDGKEKKLTVNLSSNAKAA